jgi:Zn-dependent protease with chaperone function
VKSLRSLVLVASLPLATGCATLNSMGISTPKVEVPGAGIITEATQKAEAKCGPIKTAEVSWTEERAMGGVVNVKQVADHGSLVFDLYKENDLEKLSAQVAAGKEKVVLPESPKNAAEAYLNVMGRNLAKYSARPDLPWTFAVMQNDTPNAYSAPGGYVVVTTGLLKKMTNEAQLAGVLSHEIGHVVLKHSIKRYRDSKATQCTIATTGSIVIKRAAQMAEAEARPILNLLPAETREAAKFADKFDNFDLDTAAPDFVKFVMDAVTKILELTGNEKEDEFQADATALELTAFAGYDAKEYEGFLTVLGEGGGAFSNHPSTKDRVAKLKALREGDLAPFAVGTSKNDLSKLAPLYTK